MSFSAEIKKELAEVTNRNKHCNMAEITAMYRYGGQIGRIENDSYTIGFHTENKDVIKKGFTLIKKTFNIDFDKTLSEEELFCFIHSLNEVEDQVANNLSKKTCCRRAFLRGAFLCVGSISDPEKGYHLEFVTEQEEEATYLKNILNTFSLDGKIVERKNHYVLYLKEGAQIVDLLNIMEAHNALMELENLRIVKDMRNHINRRVNCEAANINKTVNAATKQLEDIEYIKKKHGLSDLPDQLYEVATIRLENPELALKELGELLSPPVGKSGVNHRLRKISDIANKLREESIS